LDHIFSPQTPSRAFPFNTALKDQSSIGALNFANSNGIRFNPIKYKHQSIWIECTKNNKNGLSTGTWN
jgi:hypothetical protein